MLTATGRPKAAQKLLQQQPSCFLPVCRNMPLTVSLCEVPYLPEKPHRDPALPAAPLNPSARLLNYFQYGYPYCI